ncbi:MAG: excinuclease ABC subunit UvrC [Clostridiales bacterium]|nr:excinuclease ABC subunit UvrC [Clostridiales bacterium]MDY4655559.1 excinuclease ABC subunit UvrC [Eubacteriales bacterium]
MSVISDKLATLPEKSGVYIMLDEYDNVLYVGKAKILKNRVRQYFHKSVKNDKTMALVDKIKDFRYIITPNEYEALILENNLIKEYNPPYNILLKDDKTYPYIRINVKEKYPRIEVCYKLRSDGAKYFGPYMLGISVRDIMEVIEAVFPLRTCRNMPKKECLNYHLKKCLAPCVGKVTPEEYGKVVKDVIKFLNGDDAFVSELIANKMTKFAEMEEFELALHYRNVSEILEKLVRKQTIPFKQDVNIDVFTFATNGMYSVVNCFAVRGGKFLGGDNYPYYEVEKSNCLASFIMQYYEKNPVLCSEIIVGEELEFKAELADYLSEKAGKKINITTPTGGIRRQLVEMGETNCAEYLSRQLEHFNKYQEMTKGAVAQLMESLSLPCLPRRMECYDISHISGTNKVASMVVFIDGEKSSKNYRHFKIRTVQGNNDFASMYEALSRRLAKIGKSEDLSFNAKPDLIVIDGGKGQLTYALKAAEDAGVDVNFISLAKREEEVFLPGREDSVILSRNSLALKLIIRIRDEAHRFAITHHRNLRQKQMTETELTKIPGIGKEKAKILLGAFKKIEAVAAATEEELAAVKGISKKDAEQIKKYYEGEKNVKI